MTSKPFPEGADAQVRPALSVCIPSYQRRDLLLSGLKSLLELPGDFELCVHIDGSTDGSLEAANTLAQSDSRLRVSFAKNQGRAGAIYDLVSSKARGRYVLIHDDDDSITREGMAIIMDHVSRYVSDERLAGYVFHLVDQTGNQIGRDFPNNRSNFLKLRADEGIAGDKKEVVKLALLRELSLDPKGKFRRIPTSLAWSRIAENYDVECINAVVGIKRYLPGGMTAKIRKLKHANAIPMVHLYKSHLVGYATGRYTSLSAAVRAAGGLIYYSIVATYKRFSSFEVSSNSGDRRGK